MDGEFVTGILLGFLLGLIIGPILRAWLLWREVMSARREAALSDALLDRLDRSSETPPDRDAL